MIQELIVYFQPLFEATPVLLVPLNALMLVQAVEVAPWPFQLCSLQLGNAYLVSAFLSSRLLVVPF